MNQMKAAKTPKNLKEMSYAKQKKSFPILQTSSKLIKWETVKLEQLQDEISKASLSVSADISNDIKSITLEADQRKISPPWGKFWSSSKNIYNLLSIMLHITPWTLMLMLHIRQWIYLVLANVLFTSFLMFHITFDEISTTLSLQFW